MFLSTDTDTVYIGGGSAQPGNTCKVEINIADSENLGGLFIDHNETSTSRSALIVAGFLLIVAIIGKIAAGWSFIIDKPTDRLVVGLGMMPRGEVGLIFLGLGTSAGLLTPSLEAAILLMVIGTTFLAPVLLRIVLKDKDPGDGNQISDDVAADPVGLR